MLPLLQARVASIWATLGEYVAEITVLSADYHAFKLKVVLSDGSTLRVSEQYSQGVLERYAYYWLAQDSSLLVGWDNVPHHSRFPTFPHHKHVGSQDNVHASRETSPEAILAAIRERLA